MTLLPTPQVADRTGGHRTRSGARSDELLLPGVASAYAEGALLPTPRATDGTKGGPNQRGSSGDLMLPSAVVQLLPTPIASDANTEAQSDLDRRNSPQLRALGRMLPASQNKWGRFAEAIRSHEALTRRPAPRPTEPNSSGGERLSPAFAEWLMTWPLGWVTGPALGLSRVEQLTIIGNGVVPPQAVAAFRKLLTFTAPPELEIVPSECGDQYALAINPEGGVA